MTKETDLQFDDENKPKRSLVDSVDDRVKINNREDDEQSLAEIAKSKAKLDTKFLYEWVDDDPILQQDLEAFKKKADIGYYSENGFGNRADVHDLAEIILRAKRRHGK